MFSYTYPVNGNHVDGNIHSATCQAQDTSFSPFKEHNGQDIGKGDKQAHSGCCHCAKGNFVQPGAFPVGVDAFADLH